MNNKIMNSAIISLIFAIAVEIQVPPCFVLAIALTENESLNPMAVSKKNNDGTVDRGIMQLNSRYFDIEWWIPEINIRYGCLLIRELSQKGLNWWQVAIAYNCGYARLMSKDGPPNISIEYANRVYFKWQELEYRRIM
jgi:soluble lytic murein transglycosylase-like protein